MSGKQTTRNHDNNQQLEPSHEQQHSRAMPGGSSRAHRDYANVAPPTGSRPGRIGKPAHVGPQTMPVYPDMFGGLLGSTSGQASDYAPPAQSPTAQSAVQMRGRQLADPTTTQAAATKGVAGSGQQLPHLDRIQESFGSHDVTGIDAHVGGAAAQACTTIGAQAYATGNSVAFAGAPDLHTTAHEAAHVVQQRAGVQLKGGVGQAGDVYEQNADAVADRVVAGESAVALLGVPTTVSTTGRVQLKGERTNNGLPQGLKPIEHSPTTTQPPKPALPDKSSRQANLWVSEPVLNFGKIVAGFEKTLQVTVTNLGQDDVFINDIVGTNGDLPKGISIYGFESGAIIDAGQWITVTVGLKAHTKRQAVLHVLTSDGISAATITVKGEGFMPKPGAPPAGDGHGSHNPRHPTQPGRPDDMAPLDWRTHPAAVPPKIPRTVNLDPGKTVPAAAATKLPRTYDPTGDRATCWNAFRADCLKVQTAWNGAVPHLALLTNPSDKKKLLGRRLMLPSDDWQGSLADLVNQQSVGGRKVGDLFKQGKLVASKGDRAAINRAAGENGRNMTRRRFAQSAVAESEAKAAFYVIKKAAAELESANGGLKRALHAIEEEKALRAGAAARAALEALKKRVKGVATIMVLPAKIYAQLKDLDGTEEAFWQILLQASWGDDILKLRQEIESAKVAQDNARWEKLKSDYEANSQKVLARTIAITTAQTALTGKLTARTSAYDQASMMVAKASGGGRTGDRIGSMIAAIPRVETVVAHLSTALSSLPAQPNFPGYTQESGIGFRMGMQAQNWAAIEFPTTRGWIAPTRLSLGKRRADWTNKLRSLRQIKTQLEGRVAGATKL